MTRLSLRIDLERGRIGPGKIALLERIAETGSISAAARALKMSYKRAWDLVEEASRVLGRPVAETKAGGPSGGGAILTPAGRELVERFRAIEQAAQFAARQHIKALEAVTGSLGKRPEIDP